MNFLKINNTKDAAVKTGKWSNPGAKFYDKLLDSHDSRWNHNGRNVFPEDEVAKEWDYWPDFLKEAYLIAPVKDIKNTPYGRTPFSSSGCKYPHHVIRNGELVLSVPGIKAAYARAKQQGVYKGELKTHLERHIKELGDLVNFEEKIEENFNHIYQFIQEKTGINLFDNLCESISERFYRISYNGIGIYQALKQSMDIDTWKTILDSDIFKWLPSPKRYPSHFRSYFTEEGYKMFNIKVYPLLEKYLDIDKIKIETFIDIPNIVYRDEYQVIVDSNSNISIETIRESFNWIDNFVHNEEFRENSYNMMIELNDPNALMTWMRNNIKYGWRSSEDNKIHGTGEEDDENYFFNYYRLQSPSQTAESRVGVCWDQCELERRWFGKHGIEHGVFYIELQDQKCLPTHTFLVYKLYDAYWWFEHSWGDMRGIRKYDDLRSLIIDVVLKHQAANNDRTSPVYVSWLQEPPTYGITCEQFMQYAHSQRQLDVNNLPITFYESSLEYDPPLPYDQLPDYLRNDPIHAWRAKTGIELIHKEPSLEELNRIWDNWQLMTDEQKQISDNKSIEFFGKDNKTHYQELITSYYSEKYLNESEEVVEDNTDGPPPLPDEESTQEVDNQDTTSPEDDGPPELVEPESEEPQSEETPEEVVEEQPSVETPVEEPKPESRPKQVDKSESDKNGVRRKKLYIAFIEWCKEFNPKNTFGSIFDKDAFKVSYPFVPDEMRYFYRLANPMLCVLAGDLTFFPVAELRKLNSKNSQLDKMMIFAATPNDLRVFNRDDKKVYRGTEENGSIKLAEVLGDTYDLYIQKMINKGDILNAPLDESVDYSIYW